MGRRKTKTRQADTRKWVKVGNKWRRRGGRRHLRHIAAKPATTSIGDERAGWTIGMPYADYLLTEHWFSLRDSLCKNAKCHVCGGDGRVQLHHVRYRLGLEKLGDVIPVCRKCHKAIHETLDKMFPGRDLAFKVARTDEAIVKLNTNLESPPSKVTGGRPKKSRRKYRSLPMVWSRSQLGAPRKPGKMSVFKAAAEDAPLTVRSQLKITTGRRMSELLSSRRPANGQGESTANQSDDQPQQQGRKNFAGFQRRSRNK